MSLDNRLSFCTSHKTAVQMSGSAYTSFTALPHGCQSLNAVNLWNRLLICAFVGALLLFSRAFVFSGSSDCLSPPMNRSGSCLELTTGSLLLENARTKIHNEDSFPNWNAASSQNITADLDLPYAQARENIPEQSTLVEEKPQHISTDPKRFRPLRFSYSPQRISGPHARTSDGGDVESAMYNPDRRQNFYSPEYDPLELEPFFALGGLGDQGQSFALKIWLDRRDLLSTGAGRIEICQGSSGVKCWPDN
ncbi:hypothetical protein B0H34DRAFT_807817 [Crassisporium funariophilum]|nr:hypothetical protein B0H34DRAFT_807817 [Crassisporium funariophilum]